MEFTAQQKKVIEKRNSDILVSAAAGSGKTAVLVERIIERICDDKDSVDIDRILVCTFTRAAAREMRERIFAALNKRAKEHPDDHRIQMQLALVHNASISTIHGFCQTLIRNYFHTVGIDPSRRVADEGELVLLKNEVMEALLEERYREGDKAFLALTDTFAKRDRDDALAELVWQLHEASLSFPYPKEWLRDLARPYEAGDEEEILQSEWMRLLLAAVRDQLGGLVEESRLLWDEISFANEEHPYLEAVASDLEGLQGLLAADSYDTMYQALASFRFVALSRKKTDEDPAVKESYRKRRDTIKKELKSIREGLLAKSVSEIHREMGDLAERIKALSALCIDFLERYDEAKEKRRIMDFSDLEHFALSILVDEATGERTPAAEALSEFYAEIMVDEYQDSNFLQEKILSSITRQQNGRHNYFMVGDVKQSIYRFRQARPDIFIRKYREGQKEDPDSVCIDLDRNFRSRPEVTESVNAVFTRIMHREMGGVEYDASQSLKCGRRFEEAGEADFKTELLLSDASQQQSGGFESRTAYEAAIVAARIKALIEKGYCTDKEDGTLRRVRYSDIAILHRSANSVAGVFQDTLKEYGIPSHIVSVTGYFSSICVEVLLSILKIINNPRQDVALAAVLKSPLFAFSDEKLVQIRLNAAERREPFYKALWQYGQEDLRTKEFLETLGRWRKLADRVPLYELLRTVLHETDYLAYVSALPGGDARARNIEKLLSLSIQFENTSYKGLFYFVRYIERMQRYEQDFGQAKAGSDGEAVSIMTIHKSKGLEFPIVFLSGTTKKLGGRPERILVHPDLGVGMHNIDPEKRTRRSTVYRALLSHLNEQEDLGEEQRVLYVAMTRAKDKLIVTGVADKLEEKLEGCAGGTFSRLQIQKARTYLDWILPVAAARADLFEIKTMELGDLVLAETAEQMVGDARLSHLRQKVEQCPPEQIMNLKEELDFHYPHPVHDERKAKYSVSEIKHRSMEALAQESEEAEDVFDIRERKSYIPRFVSGEDPVYAGAQRGTAVHRYLECFDFAREEYVTSYEAQKAEMLSDGRLKEEDAKLLQGDKLQLFLRSDLAARMHRAAAAGYLKKEAAFVMMDSYEHFFEDADAVRESEDLEDPVLVQGIIDAFFEEEDGLVLIDYKTDRIRRESDLSDRYRKQMELYADALSRTHGKKVKEIYLYSFALGCAIMVS